MSTLAERYAASALRGQQHEDAALPPPGTWWRYALDAIDLGVCIVDLSGRLEYANTVAQTQLAGTFPLRIENGFLEPVDQKDRDRLALALSDVPLGRRHLIGAGSTSERVDFSVLPLARGTHHPNSAMLIFGRRQTASALSLLAFAREHQLTAAEEAVLLGLALGLTPRVLAARYKVAISTVRTQLASIRAKTGLRSTNELITSIARLPPMQLLLEAMEARTSAAPDNLAGESGLALELLRHSASDDAEIERITSDLRQLEARAGLASAQFDDVISFLSESDSRVEIGYAAIRDALAIEYSQGVSQS